MSHDPLRALSSSRLEILQFAVGTILNVAEEGLLSDPLESEPYEFRIHLADARARQGT